MRYLLCFLGYSASLAYAALAFSKGIPAASWGATQLILLVMLLLTDINFLVSTKRNALSRTSQSLVLAAILSSPGFGAATLLAYSVGTLLLVNGSSERKWSIDFGLSLFPLAATGLIMGMVLPSDPSGYFAAVELCFFLMLCLEPKNKALQTTFLVKLGTPGIALAAHFTGLAHPFLLILLWPVLSGLSAAGANDDSLLRRMREALTKSHSKLEDKDKALKRTRMKLTQMEVLVEASQSLVSSLDPKELRELGVKHFQQLGLKKFRYAEHISKQEELDFAHYNFGTEHGFLIVGDKLEPKTSGGLQVLVKMFATTLQNASLHLQVVETLKQLKLSQKQLVAQNQLAAVGRLAAGVAHEVNTPLAAIKVSLESSVKGLERAPERVRPKLERALKAVERARLSIERILQYSRGGRNQPPKWFLPASALSDCLELLKERFNRLSVEVEPTIEMNSELFGVEHDFFGLLSNLLLNAAEAAEGSDLGKIVVKLGERDSECCVLVEDSGSGIPQNMTEKIFESFFTTKEAGKGTGLGLSLVQEVVDNFGGNIKVSQSSDLGGASFFVRLPITEKVQETVLVQPS